MTDKVQKIRKGIERLKSQLIKGACASQIAMETRCKEEAYNEVLAILDSLQEEPVSERFAFKAIPRLLEMIEPTDRAKAYIAKLADTLEVEGYLTDAKIVRESLKIMNGEKVSMATMDEEPVSEDMWEASKQYALRQVLASTDTEMSEQAYLNLRLFSGFELAVAHKDGAKWQKEQMMKDAIEAEIINWASMFTSIKVLEPERAEAMIKEKFNIGDKVKLIVIKED